MIPTTPMVWIMLNLSFKNILAKIIVTTGKEAATGATIEALRLLMPKL